MSRAAATLLNSLPSHTYTYTSSPLFLSNVVCKDRKDSPDTVVGDNSPVIKLSDQWSVKSPIWLTGTTGKVGGVVEFQYHLM